MTEDDTFPRLKRSSWEQVNYNVDLIHPANISDWLTKRTAVIIHHGWTVSEYDQEYLLHLHYYDRVGYR